MKNTQKNRAKFLLFGIVLVCAAAAVMFFMPQAEKASYSKFQADLSSGAVDAVVFQDETLGVTLKSGEKYEAPNPDSPALKEELDHWK